MPMLLVLHAFLEVFVVLAKQIGEECAVLRWNGVKLVLLGIGKIVARPDAVVVDAEVAKQVQNFQDLVLI